MCIGNVDNGPEGKRNIDFSRQLYPFESLAFEVSVGRSGERVDVVQRYFTASPPNRLLFCHHVLPILQ